MYTLIFTLISAAAFNVGIVLLFAVKTMSMLGNLFFISGVVLFASGRYLQYRKDKNQLNKYFAEDAKKLMSICNDSSDKTTAEEKWVRGEVYAYLQDKKSPSSKKILKKRIIYTILFAVVLYIVAQKYLATGVFVLLCCIVTMIYIGLLSNLTIWNITYKSARKNYNSEISEILDNDVFEDENNKKSIRNIVISAVIIAVTVVGFFVVNFRSSYTVGKVDGGYTIESWSAGFNSVVEIPAEIDGKKVISISESAFEDSIFVKKVILPDTITRIDSKAFKNCRRLENINLPPNLVILNGEAFMNCYNLESIVIPDGVTEIRGSTFENCYSLKTVVMHNDIIDIHAYAFSGCESLVNVTLPSGIERIAEGTFEYCESLEKIVIPDGVTKISAHAFNQCSSLSEVTVPRNLSEVGSSAFRACYNLYSITLSYSTIVDERAFKDSPTEIKYYPLNFEEDTENIKKSDEEHIPSSTPEYPVFTPDILPSNIFDIIYG